MDFSYYRNDHQEEFKRFDCNYCIQKGNNDTKMVCFRNSNKKMLNLPTIPDNFHKQIDVSQSNVYNDFDRSLKEITKEELIDYYTQIRSLFPNERAYKVWFMPLMRIGPKNQPVCPVAFFSKKLNDIVSWESAADKYGVLPYKGSYLDQPLYVIEGFDICREAASKYTNSKMEESKKKNKDNNSSQRNPRRR